MNNEESSAPIEINSEQAFTPDPIYHLMGVFPDRNGGTAVIEQLTSGGFDPANIELFCGVEGAETYDFSGKDHGIGATLLRKFRNITFDRVILDRYEMALKQGHCVMMIKIDKPEQKIDASALMEAGGASQVDYFGLAATEAFPHHANERPDPDATY